MLIFNILHILIDIKSSLLHIDSTHLECYVKQKPGSGYIRRV